MFLEDTGVFILIAPTPPPPTVSLFLLSQDEHLEHTLIFWSAVMLLLRGPVSMLNTA